MRHTPQERCSLINDPLVKCSLIKRTAFLTNQSARGNVERCTVRLSTQIGLAQYARSRSPTTSNPIYNPTNILTKTPFFTLQYARSFSSCTITSISEPSNHLKHQIKQASDGMAGVSASKKSTRKPSWRIENVRKARAAKVCPKTRFFLGVFTARANFRLKKSPKKVPKKLPATPKKQKKQTADTMPSSCIKGKFSIVSSSTPSKN